MNSVVLPIVWLLYFKTVNRKVQGVSQSQTTASPRHQEKEKMTKTNQYKKKQNPPKNNNNNNNKQMHEKHRDQIPLPQERW